MNGVWRTLAIIGVASFVYGLFCVFLYWIDSRLIGFVLGNFMVAVDKVLGSWLMLPPFLSWTLMGLIIGTFVHLSVLEGHRFNSIPLRVAVLIVPVVVLLVSPVLWSRMQLRVASTMMFTDDNEHRPGEELQIGEFWFVWVPAGRFRMGSEPGEPGRNIDEVPHVVTISRGFWLSKYEVTQRQWMDVMGANPSKFAGCQDCPVESVSAADCQTFIQKLLELTQKRYRLPTEAEWEFAARAGTQSAWSCGDGIAELDAHAWFSDNSESKPHPVGSKDPNAWGLHDMHGNVREWCSDYYAEYASTRQIDPVGPAAGQLRVLRGGGWGSSALECRSARRGTYREGFFEPTDDVGLRLIYDDRPVASAEGEGEGEQADEDGARPRLRRSLGDRLARPDAPTPARAVP